MPGVSISLAARRVRAPRALPAALLVWLAVATVACVSDDASGVDDVAPVDDAVGVDDAAQDGDSARDADGTQVDADAADLKPTDLAPTDLAHDERQASDPALDLDAAPDVALDGAGAGDPDRDRADIDVPDAAVPGPPLIEQLDEIEDRDGEGRPILIRSPALMPGGLELALVYDESVEDPITRWASCLALVRDCLPPASGDPDACVEDLPSCPDDTGGPGCCAPACVSAFFDSRDGGADVDAAWEASFLDGRCVEGLAELVGLPPLEATP